MTKRSKKPVQWSNREKAILEQLRRFARQYGGKQTVKRGGGGRAAVRRAAKMTVRKGIRKGF